MKILISNTDAIQFDNYQSFHTIVAMIGQHGYHWNPGAMGEGHFFIYRREDETGESQKVSFGSYVVFYNEKIEVISETDFSNRFKLA